MPPSAPYKSQPSIHRTRGKVPLAGNAHVYTVNKVICHEEVEEFLATLLVGKTLHVCCGKSQLGDVRLDLHEESADNRCDAADMRAHVADQSFDTVLYEGPDNGKLDWLHKVHDELARVARKRIIVQAQWVPADKHGRYRKAQEEFGLSGLYTWMPDTYFERANLISVFDRDGEVNSPVVDTAVIDQSHATALAPQFNSDPRRQRGEYATPECYAQLAHEYLQRAAGGNSDDLYNRTWWDPACGDGMLTRPRPLDAPGELLLSSLGVTDRGDTENTAALEGQGTFEFDFVNQPDSELPSAVVAALSTNKRWVFLVNPPFTASTSYRADRLPGVSDSAVAKEMAKQGMKLASHVSTLQFMHRLASLVERYSLDALIGVFAQPTFLTHDSYRVFRERWQQQFQFRDGFCLNSREFNTVGDWPLVFTVWESCLVKRTQYLNHAVATDVYINGKAAGAKEFGPAAVPLSSWVRRPLNTVPALALTSAIKPATRKVTRRLPEDALGFAAFSTNDVFHSKQCALYSSATSEGSGWGVVEENFEESLVSLAARRLVKPTWLNDRDQFSAPDVQHRGYRQWSKDAIAWLLASGANHSASFRYIGADGAVFDIRNHFFWMRPDEIRGLRTMPDSAKMGAEKATVPFCAEWLSKQTFSSDAAEVIESMRVLTVETAVLRASADSKYHLDRWDAGWYQIRMALLWEANAPKRAQGAIEEYRSFKRTLVALGKRLEDGLYQLNVLHNSP